MTTQVFTVVETKGIRRGDILGIWTLKSGDTAEPLMVPRYSDKSVHIFGTWNGATVSMQATNDPNLNTYGEAYDPEGMNISQTLDGNPTIIFPNVLAIKPVISGGDAGTKITVAIVGHGEH